MRKKVLAERIILQAAEDLFDPKRSTESIEFFTGAGFRDCAAMAGMKHDDMLGFLEFVKKLMAGMPIKPASKNSAIEKSKQQEQQPKRAYLWY